MKWSGKRGDFSLKGVGYRVNTSGKRGRGSSGRRIRGRGERRVNYLNRGQSVQQSRREGSIVFEHLILTKVLFFETYLRNVVNAMLTLWRWHWANLPQVLKWHECALSSCWWVTPPQSPHSLMDTTVMPTSTAGFLVRKPHTTLSLYNPYSTGGNTSYGW